MCVLLSHLSEITAGGRQFRIYYTQTQKQARKKFFLVFLFIFFSFAFISHFLCARSFIASDHFRSFKQCVFLCVVEENVRRLHAVANIPFVCVTRRLDLGLAIAVAAATAVKCKTIVRFLSPNHFSFCGFTNQVLLLLHNNAFYADVVQTIRKCDKRKREWEEDHLHSWLQHAYTEKKPRRTHTHILAHSISHSQCSGAIKILNIKMSYP